MINIAHRGASGYLPENSFAAFERALEMGADMIELDVFRCESGELVVIHDRTLDRTTGFHGLVEKTSYTVIKTLDAGDGRPLPLLREVLELVNRRVPVNIEIKGTGVAEPASRLIQSLFSRGWKPADFLVSSFNHRELLQFSRHEPSVPRGVLLGALPVDLAQCGQELGAQTVNISLELALPELVEDAHRRGMKVFVYTVNDEADLRAMREIGVDGVFCNFPDRVKAFQKS